ncbi:hypothetical protein ARMA_1053 [Ardenticatena maritima]|uniref:Alpha-2-macroglobulin n=1 Tax=Ardenticatena maritima TaxID=872965 RepID=A0A0M9UC96_9CHLR|nr:Ig-like domain-containing protein [Ardenticatena maritima]KPL87242.1 hypothetical protein SE16_12100 [Ardenticatena maritima]GAP62630.1 hypothetical protein ARMA_1053 [Ardenticatena maritima]
MRNKRTLFLILMGVVVLVGGLWFVWQQYVAATPPTIVEIQPQETIERHDSIVLVFDQPMDHASVEAAFRITPPVEGVFRWEPAGKGERLIFTPTEPLPAETTLTITLSADAKSARGKPLREAFTAQLRTPAAITVVNVSPPAGSEEVTLQTPIVVQFNRDVVQFASFEEQTNVANPFRITPEVRGFVRWVAPNVLGFYPEEELKPGTTYTVRLDPSIAPGIALDEPLEWSFTTAGVGVLASIPFDGAAEVDVGTSITVILSAPPDDPDAFAEAFSVRDAESGQEVEGVLAWETETRLVFTPTTALAPDTTYEIVIEPTGVAARSLAEYRATFTTLSSLHVESVIPEPGTVDVPTDPDETFIAVKFNHPVVPLVGIAQQAGLPVPLTIDPPLEGTGEWVSTSYFVFSPDEPLRIGQTYTVTVPAGLTDTVGTVLAEPFTWHFITEGPHVVQLLPETPMIGATSPITIVFSHPMDAASVAEHLRVQRVVNGEPLPVSLEWPAEDTLVVRPQAPYPYGEKISIMVLDGALGRVGGVMRKTFTEERHVAPVPRVIGFPEGKSIKPYEPIQLAFNAPMDLEALRSAITITPDPGKYWLDTMFAPHETRRWRYTLRPHSGWEAGQVYTMTIGTTAASIYGDRLEEPVRFTFRVEDLPPLVELIGADYRFAMFSTVTDTVQIVRVRNVERVEMNVYALSENQFFNLVNSFWNLNNPFATDQEPVATWTLDTSQSPRNEANLYKTRVPPEGALEPGLYVFSATAYRTLDDGTLKEVEHDNRFAVVSPYNVLLKVGPQDALVWVTNLADGASASGLHVKLYAQREKMARIGEGETDEDGLLHLTFDETRIGWETVWAVVLDADGRPVGLTSSDWYEGAEPWLFNIDRDLSLPPLRGTIYTDRPIYRPGQRVYFRGVVWSDQDAIYTPLAGETALLTILDPQRETLERRQITLSPFGTFSGEFELNADAPLGSYSIELALGDGYDRIWGTFGVIEYRLPEFEVQVTPAAPEVKQGEPLSATIQANYFFGGAVANGRVNWRILQAPYYFDGGLPGYWSWRDSDDERDWYFFFFREEQEVLASGSAELDEQGTYHLDVPTIFPETTQAVRLTIEADVSDASNAVVSGRGSVVVHPGDFYIGLRARTFVGEVGEPITFDVRTLTPQREPFGNADIELTLARREWYSVQVEDENGATYWTTRFTDTVESVERVRTDAEGQATVSFTPTFGGVYTVLATGRDAQGREIRSRAFVWVSSGNYVGWRTENNRRMDLVADQREYAPGDTAHILVPTPYTGMKALVTVERATIRRAWIVDLPTNSTMIEVPLDAMDAPNVYVSVTALKSAADGHLPDIRLGYINLPVALTEQTLQVEVIPDPEPPFEPRQTVTFTLRATTHDGAPVPNVEFSAAMVDKALLSLAEDPNPDLMKTFYDKRPLSIQTGGSLFINVDIVSRDLAPEAKGGGGGGGGMALPLNVRENFQETAFWQADLRTDERGEVRFSVTLPDNLTTWVLAVRGVTQDGRVAQTTYETLTTRIFFVRPVAPRFFVVGDHALLKAIVHNNTSEPLTTTVAFSAEGLTVAGETTRQVVIQPNSAQTALFEVDVPYGETARMLFHAVAPGYEDAVALTVPVYHRTTPSVVATAGQVRQGQVVERFILPPDTDPTQGGLTVEIAPSLAGLTQSSLEYLRTYPYACSEQVVSSFLPNIMTYRALHDAGLVRTDLEPSLRANINLAVQRLIHTQNRDGGWGWWYPEGSRPWLTAYALLGLHYAKEAGFNVPDRVLERAQSYLTNVVERTSNDERPFVLDTRAFILYVLAERGDVDTGRLVALYDKRDLLGNDGLAFLTMALAHAGDEQAERVQSLVTMLTGRALMSATGAHWEESDPDALAMDSSQRTTALVLDALVKTRPNHMLIPETVRWLMNVRRAKAWETTQTTAWAVMALTDYMVASGELQADFAYRVTLNDEVLLEEHVSRDNLLEPRRLERAIKDLLLDEANELVIARTDDGPGRLYYAAWVEYFSNIETVPPLERGIAVSRRYELADPFTFESTGVEVNPEALRVGDVVMVRLTVVAPTTLSYFILEDPLPAGFEAIDPSLLTSSQVAEGPRGQRLDSRSRFWYGDWTRSEIRDEKVALFKTVLRRGTYEYTYLARVTQAGTFTALPAVAYEMYHPEVFGRSASMQVAIGE